MKKPLLVVVAGPTAVGKTATSIDLALHYHTEIISADSRQFYKEMEIGTAKPDAMELAAVPHHFVDSHSITEDYDAGHFAEEANALLLELFQKHEVVFVVGGSGLYIKALCEGLDDMPTVPEDVRVQLRREFEQNGLVPLLEELQSSDPVYYDQVDRKNHQRVIRALEVTRHTGMPFTHYRSAQTQTSRPYEVIKIGIEEDRAVLYERIDQRMDQMIAAGLFDEAKALYPQKGLNALQTVGYREIFGYLGEDYDYEEAVRLLKRNSRRYAKRQMTWFKRDESFVWFQRTQLEEMIRMIDEKMRAG